jgi:hypothetical protein
MPAKEETSMSENGMQKIDEKELSGVAGGAGDGLHTDYDYEPNGICSCGKTRYYVTSTTRDADGNIIDIHKFYECIACGPLEFIQ